MTSDVKRSLCKIGTFLGRGLDILLPVAYPFAVYFGLRYQGVLTTALLLLALFAVRFLRQFAGGSRGTPVPKPTTPDAPPDATPDAPATPQEPEPARPRPPAILRRLGLLLGVSGAVLVLLALLLRNEALFLYYPVAVNLSLLGAFAWTLRTPPSMIECFARLSDPNLPAAAIPYTRRFTKIWCAFFLFNATIALLTCLHGDPALWALYNGLISYILIAVLFGAERLVRPKY